MKCLNKNGFALLFAVGFVLIFGMVAVGLVFLNGMNNRREIERLNMQEGYFTSEIAAYVNYFGTPTVASFTNFSFGNNYLDELQPAQNVSLSNYVSGKPIPVLETWVFDREQSASATSMLRRSIASNSVSANVSLTSLADVTGAVFRASTSFGAKRGYLVSLQWDLSCDLSVQALSSGAVNLNLTATGADSSAIANFEWEAAGSAAFNSISQVAVVGGAASALNVPMPSGPAPITFIAKLSDRGIVRQCSVHQCSLVATNTAPTPGSNFSLTLTAGKTAKSPVPVTVNSLPNASIPLTAGASSATGTVTETAGASGTYVYSATVLDTDGSNPSTCSATVTPVANGCTLVASASSVYEASPLTLTLTPLGPTTSASINGQVLSPGQWSLTLNSPNNPGTVTYSANVVGSTGAATCTVPVQVLPSSCTLVVNPSTVNFGSVFDVTLFVTGTYSSADISAAFGFGTFSVTSGQPVALTAPYVGQTGGTGISFTGNVFAPQGLVTCGTTITDFYIMHKVTPCFKSPCTCSGIPVWNNTGMSIQACAS